MKFSMRHPRVPARHRWLQAAMLLVLAIGPAVQAQEGGPPPLPSADLKAIDGFALNEDLLQRLMAVVHEGHTLGIRPSQPPANQTQSAYTLDNIAAQAVQSDPRIVPLLARHGFTPRQFLLTNMAMSSAALAVQAKQHPELAAYADPAHVNPGNVAFYEAHIAEITSFLRAQQDAAPQADPGAGPAPGARGEGSASPAG